MEVSGRVGHPPPPRRFTPKERGPGTRRAEAGSFIANNYVVKNLQVKCKESKMYLVYG
jgi:hypothetical protein